MHDPPSQSDGGSYLITADCADAYPLYPAITRIAGSLEIMFGSLNSNDDASNSGYSVALQFT